MAVGEDMVVVDGKRLQGERSLSRMLGRVDDTRGKCLCLY